MARQKSSWTCVSILLTATALIVFGCMGQSPSLGPIEVHRNPVLSADHPALNLLLIADTIDHAQQVPPGSLLSSATPGSSIARGVKQSRFDMNVILDNVSAATQLPLNRVEILGSSSPQDDNFNCANIIKTIQDFSKTIVPGDVAFVYYAGHGFAFNNQRVPSAVVGELYSSNGFRGSAVSTKMPYMYCV